MAIPAEAGGPGAQEGFVPGCVTVIMAARNARQWIGDALESIYLQEHRPIEVLVIDDGSEDGTHTVAEAFAARVPVRVIRETGRGPAAARNRGLAEAKGEFIQFLDADDAIEPTKISRQVAFARSTGAAVVWGGFARAYDNGKGLAAAPRQEVRPGIGDDVEADLITEDGFIPLAAMLIRRVEGLASVRMREDMTVLEDIRFHFALLDAGARYVEHPWLSGLVVREHQTPTRASLSSKVNFWRACVANAADREHAWRSAHSLTPRRARILASAYVYAARELATIAPDASRDAARRAKHVDPRFYDFVSPRLRILTRVFGLSTVERFAAIGRRLRTVVSTRP